MKASHECLLNIGDSLLVTFGRLLSVGNILSIMVHHLDIIFLMMEIVHTGSPLSTIAEVLMQNISLRNERLDALPSSRKDWLCRLLYTGKSEINMF